MTCKHFACKDCGAAMEEHAEVIVWRQALIYIKSMLDNSEPVNGGRGGQHVSRTPRWIMMPQSIRHDLRRILDEAKP